MSNTLDEQYFLAWANEQAALLRGGAVRGRGGAARSTSTTSLKKSRA